MRQWPRSKGPEDGAEEFKAGGYAMVRDDFGNESVDEEHTLATLASEGLFRGEKYRILGYFEYEPDDEPQVVLAPLDFPEEAVEQFRGKTMLHQIPEELAPAVQIAPAVFLRAVEAPTKH